MFCQEFPALSALKDLVHHSGFEASGGWVVTCLLEAFQKGPPMDVQEFSLHKLG